MPYKDRVTAGRKKREEWRAQGLCGTCGRQPDPPYKRCAKCRERDRKWRHGHGKSRVVASRKRTAELRKAKVLAHYGPDCACCGESEPVFLTIDHVNGDGAAHRRQIGRAEIYRWLIQQGFPDGFQVLCWNCNLAKHLLGSCPHLESPS